MATTQREPAITTVSDREYMMKVLADPVEAAYFLNAVAEDNDIKFLLSTLRDVVKAQGGMGMLAKKTGLSRTTLYRTLSVNGNPEVTTLDSILAVYGIRIGFFPREAKPLQVASPRGRYRVDSRKVSAKRRKPSSRLTRGL